MWSKASILRKYASLLIKNIEMLKKERI